MALVFGVNSLTPGVIWEEMANKTFWGALFHSFTMNAGSTCSMKLKHLHLQRAEIQGTLFFVHLTACPPNMFVLSKHSQT